MPRVSALAGCDRLAQKEFDIKEGLKVKAYEISVVKEKHDELVKQSLLIKSHYEGLAKEKTKNDSFAFVHELKQEMHADLKYVESLKDEIDKLESDKVEFSNMYDLLLKEFRECDCLAQKISEQTEFVSKEIYTELLQSFAKLEKHSISLEFALQQCQEQLKNDTIYKEKASNVFRNEREQYFEIQDLKAQLQDKNIVISELKKLIEKYKGKSVDTKFDKPSVVRQPNAQRIPKPSVLGKLAPFSDSLERKYFAKKKSVSKTNELEGLSKPVTPQNLPQTASNAIRKHKYCSTHFIFIVDLDAPKNVTGNLSLLKYHDQKGLLRRRSQSHLLLGGQFCDAGFGGFFVAYAAQQVFSNLSDGRKNGISLMVFKEEVLCCTTRRIRDPDSRQSIYRLRKALIWIETRSETLSDETLKIPDYPKVLLSTEVGVCVILYESDCVNTEFLLRIHKDGDGDASFKLKSDSITHAHALNLTKDISISIQASRIMKAQEL
ncbi:hypothetical protein Tco_0289547 [Tanacetum coccineum]